MEKILNLGGISNYLTDMNIDIIGYLNNNMELIKFEK